MVRVLDEKDDDDEDKADDAQNKVQRRCEKSVRRCLDERCEGAIGYLISIKETAITAAVTSPAAIQNNARPYL